MHDRIGATAIFVIVCLVSAVEAQEKPQGTVSLSLAPKALFAVNAEGTNWRRHFQLPQVSELANPAVSRDGRWIAFEGWSGPKGQVPSNASIFLVSVPRDEFRILGVGSLPSWSPDGQKLACSFHSIGVGTLTVDSQDVEIVDKQGWGAQWSPDGKSIVWVNGPDVWTYELATKKKVCTFEGKGQVQQLLQTMVWSPKGDQFAIVARKSNTEREVISVRPAEGARSLKVHFKSRNLGDKLAWHPTESRIVYSAEDPERGRLKLWEFDPAKEDAPKLFPGQDPENVIESPCWAPDGKTLFCIARAP